MVFRCQTCFEYLPSDTQLRSHIKQHSELPVSKRRKLAQGGNRDTVAQGVETPPLSEVKQESSSRLVECACCQNFVDVAILHFHAKTHVRQLEAMLKRL